MRKILQILFFTACFATTSMAQTKPLSAWQFFAGYSYLRANVREYYQPTPNEYSIRDHFANLNGWNLSATENVKTWFGGTLDGSGHYGSPQFQGTKTTQHVHSLSYGPNFFHQGKHFSPFAHVLVGFTHVSASASSTSAQASQTKLLVAPGGGLDMRLFKYGAIRLFQAEYFRANLQGSSRNQLRVSAGITFNWTRK